MCGIPRTIVIPREVGWEKTWKGTGIRLGWIVDRLRDVVMNDLTSDDDVDRWTRGYLLLVIGSYVMPNNIGNNVYSKYLYMLMDFDECGRYSRGSAVLADVYRELYKFSTSRKSNYIFNWMLLQLWFYL